MNYSLVIIELLYFNNSILSTINNMKELISHPILLISFFLITTIFGWISGDFTTKILTKMSILSMILIDTLISLVILFLFMIFNNHSIKNIKNDLKILDTKEIIFFIMLGIFGTIFGVWSTTMLKYHTVGNIEMLGFFISLIIGGIGLHLTKEKKMNFSRILGIVIIALGGYILMRE
jgi:drug/metabolite transporter (DMT)-like permease